ncbi:MAG: hypothetical protein ACYSR7_06025 [Planctomycetota bacterium]|jgi:hypothetical protein
MRTEKYFLKNLGAFFKRHKIATLDQIQRALGNPKERTVFRKLKSLDYLSSYSHRGMFYTLQSIAKFNTEGLWSHQEIWFSRFGNLLDTATAFIENSEAGYSSAELCEALHVETKHCLLKLVRVGLLRREKFQGCYVYFSSEPKKYRSQMKAREQRKHKPFTTVLVANPDLAEDEAKAVILLFISSLDERQRRLYAGLESLKLGYGGDSYIADLFGMDPHTVARGRLDLEHGDWKANRLRAEGGGRSSVEKKRLKS